MLKKSDILQFLEENKPFLQSEFHVTTIGLVGSFARNEQKEDSDIDIIVDFEPDTKHLFDIYEKMKTFFENAFNKNIDIGTLKYLKPYYKQVILKDAIFI